MQPLDMTPQERARFGSDLAFDRNSAEILVGLDRAESERHLSLDRMPQRGSNEAKEWKALQDRHDRAVYFWRIAVAASDTSSAPMQPSDAFDLGYKAWDGFAGAGQMADFQKMIEAIPQDQRLAALNGWLEAFDDEAGRLGQSQR